MKLFKLTILFLILLMNLFSDKLFARSYLGRNKDNSKPRVYNKPETRNMERRKRKEKRKKEKENEPKLERKNKFGTKRPVAGDCAAFVGIEKLKDQEQMEKLKEPIKKSDNEEEVLESVVSNEFPDESIEKFKNKVIEKNHERLNKGSEESFKVIEASSAKKLEKIGTELNKESFLQNLFKKIQNYLQNLFKKHKTKKN
ncbi:MAG: hypothetical protein ABIA74_05040 [bacterium]